MNKDSKCYIYNVYTILYEKSQLMVVYFRKRGSCRDKASRVSYNVPNHSTCLGNMVKALVDHFRVKGHVFRTMIMPVFSVGNMTFQMRPLAEGVYP